MRRQPVLHSAAMPHETLTLKPLTDPSRAYRYRDGICAADLLTAAIVDLDFFTWLAGHPSDLPTICRELGLAPRPVDVMLTLFAASGFVARANDVFVVTGTAREHLVDGSPFNLKPYYASLKDRPVVRDFSQVLRTGKPANWGGDRNGFDWHRAMEDDTFARSFTAAMDCRGHYLAQALADAIDLRDRERLLDIGGGSGIYACVLAAHHPQLSAIVFDQAPVDRIAATLVAERGCARQVSVRAGSFFTDPWPVHCDAHLFSNVLHDWDAPEVRRLLSLSFASLPVGGLLLIHDAFLNAEKTGPLPVAEYSTILMHSTQGRCYSTTEYAEMLADLGFGAVTFAETAADRGVMTARKLA
jgi:3-hydroxy-5-methyl-1-naphthoate 3-O-methyltransferase